jgi:hypothetical protein
MPVFLPIAAVIAILTATAPSQPKQLRTIRVEQDITPAQIREAGRTLCAKPDSTHVLDVMCGR